MSPDQKRIQELEAKIKAMEASKIKISVSDAGYVEVYGLPKKGRFSISLTPEGWDKVFGEEGEQIKAYVEANRKNCADKQAKYVSQKAVG